MPFCKFLKPYAGYTAGQIVDLPGKLSYKLRAEGVVVKVETAAPAPAKKIAAKKAGKKK